MDDQLSDAYSLQLFSKSFTERVEFWEMARLSGIRLFDIFIVVKFLGITPDWIFPSSFWTPWSF